MQLQFVGCGDAFGSGGRSHTCFHLTTAHTTALIDCGASSLPALNRCGIDRNAIDFILLTHFHADHFGGVPFFMLDAQFVTRRERPLTIVGPPGLRAWFERAVETAFPGMSSNRWRFPFALHEVTPGRTEVFGGLSATPHHVVHDDRAGPCLAYRIAADDKVLAYSGDTEWTDALISAGHAADLFVCECYVFDRPTRAHMSLTVLQRELPRVAAKRVVLTHMSDDMLSRLDRVPYETASDGLRVEI